MESGLLLRNGVLIYSLSKALVIVATFLTFLTTEARRLRVFADNFSLSLRASVVSFISLLKMRMPVLRLAYSVRPTTP
jgi:hypothetical protein